MKLLRMLMALVAAGAAAPLSQAAAPQVLTYHNDGSRTGANLQETVLNVSNVTSAKFGKVFSRPVDDQLYAQLLYMPGINIPGRGERNVVFAATVNDTVYAFDADYPALDIPLWKVSFLSSGVRPPTRADLSMAGACGGGYNDFSGNMGIVGTPVIDPAPFPGAEAGDQGTIYLVARTVEAGSHVQRLHALNVRTGAERPGSPVYIQGAVENGNGKTVAFNPAIQNQRPGLALVNGTVYIGWASHCDYGDYHGWLMGYDAATLRQKSVYCTTPGGSRAGIWMGGSPPSFDEAGNLYLSTGNGTIGSDSDPASTLNRGESFLKLTPSGSTMAVSSFFTPYNYQQLEGGDIDLGSAGLLLFPGSDGRKLAIGAGKQGRLYVVDRDNMGGVQQGSDSQIVQSIDVSLNNKIMGGPVYWQGPGGVKKFYVWAANSVLKAYTYNGATFNPSPQTGNVVAANPGAMLSLSANGSSSGTGILWAMCPDADANQHVVSGVLRAFNAETPSQELWNSNLNSSRDGMGSYAKFNQPTVVNGSVYVPTFSNRILVYGILPTGPAPALPVLLNATAPSKVSVHLEWGAPENGGQSGFIVERSVDGVNFEQVVYLPSEARSYDDGTVARFTNYTYRIRSFNLSGSAVSGNAPVSTAAGAPEPAIAVSGSGRDIPAGSVFITLDNGTAFGQVLPGSGAEVTRTFTVRNFGNATLELSGSPVPVSLIGSGSGDFTVTGQPPGQLAPQQTASFTIRFAPQAVGTRTATVRIATNDPFAASFDFAISGSGAQQDLAAFWHFDEEGNSLSSADATGRGHEAVLTTVFPVFKESGHFDGSIYYAGIFGSQVRPSITVADSPDLNPVDGLAIAAWVRWDGPVSGITQPIVQKGEDNSQYRLVIEESSLKFELKNVGTIVAAAPRRSTWTHLVGTYDGAAMKLYSNGVEMASLSVSGRLATTVGPLAIGSKPDTSSHFAGYIDDLRLYGRGLGAAEIQKLASQATAIGVLADLAEATKDTNSGGIFRFTTQYQKSTATQANFEIVSGPGQAVYRTDYGMSIIPPVVTFPPNNNFSYVDVMPLSFNGPTGPRDVTVRVLEGDGYAVGKNSQAVVRIFDSPFNQWKIDQFGGIAEANQPQAADDATPANDGGTNLMRFALGQGAREPFQPPVLLQSENFDGTRIGLNFVRPLPAPRGITYIPEWCPDLLEGNWQELPAWEQDNQNGTATIYVSCPDPISQRPCAFMRLRVTRP